MTIKPSDRKYEFGAQRMMDDVLAALRVDGRVKVEGFGIFTVKQCAATRRRNPKTGAMVDVPAKTKVKFKAQDALNEYVAIQKS